MALRTRSVLTHAEGKSTESVILPKSDKMTALTLRRNCPHRCKIMHPQLRRRRILHNIAHTGPIHTQARTELEADILSI